MEVEYEDYPYTWAVRWLNYLYFGICFGLGDSSDTWRHSKEGTKQDLEQATLKKQARRDGCLPEQGRGASRERDT